MLKLATARDARFGVDDRELRRSGNTYTYDSLAEIRAERGSELPIVFLTGTDTFAKLDTWHRCAELFDLAHFGVAIRADDEQWFSKGPGAFPKEIWPRITLSLRELLGSPAGKVMTYRMTPLAISSTAIREMAGSGSSIRYLTPDPVVEYIRTHKLYTPAHQETAVPDAAR
jgi:nicotinate-nucleotide adenylyltransferase